jgi:hypothetical protein
VSALGRSKSKGCPLPCTRRAGTGRPRPASAVRKTSRLIPSLRSTTRRVRMRPSTDSGRAELRRSALGRQMSGALMRRWSFEIYADHRDRTRREESPRRFSCFAARGPLQTAAAVQHRHDAGGQRSASSWDGLQKSARILGLSRSVASGWRGTGPPRRRAGDTRDKRFVPSTRWGCPATGPARGAEATQNGSKDIGGAQDPQL